MCRVNVGATRVYLSTRYDHAPRTERWKESVALNRTVAKRKIVRLTSVHLMKRRIRGHDDLPV